MHEPPTDIEVKDTVQSALDELPPDLARRLHNVAIVVEDRHPKGLMGIYDPVGGIQRIVIFREANPSLAEVRKTVLHEVGHHFGMNERQLHELGYG